MRYSHRQVCTTRTFEGLWVTRSDALVRYGWHGDIARFIVAMGYLETHAFWLQQIAKQRCWCFRLKFLWLANNESSFKSHSDSQHASVCFRGLVMQRDPFRACTISYEKQLLCNVGHDPQCTPALSDLTNSSQSFAVSNIHANAIVVWCHPSI